MRTGAVATQATPTSGGCFSDRRPTVLLADDHPMILGGLRSLLEPELEVVGTAADGRALLAAAKELRPDLVVADLSMPEIDGIEAIRQLRTIAPDTRVLVLSIHTEASWVREAFAAGACAYLTKTSRAEEITNAIREVLSGCYYVSPLVARAAIGLATENPAESLAGVAREPLTARELEVVHLVGTGLGNKDIARRLGVSVTTVRTHLGRIYGKLELKSRVELALYAARPGGDLR